MARGKSVTKSLLDSSQAALFAGIEIHNKPHISYRYPTVSILIISAWELALKAYVYKYIGKKQLFENDGKHTKSFSKILVRAKDHINEVEKNKKFKAVFDNLCLLYEYRNSNVHFVESKLDPVMFMLISKAVLNYEVFVKKYFKRDITKGDNLIILPLGMKLPLSPIEYLKQDYGKASNEFVNRVVHSIRELNAEGIQESVVVGFDVCANRVREEGNADIIVTLDNREGAIPFRRTIRVTDDPNAPVFRIMPDLPPLRYYDLRDKCKERNPEIKFGRVFNLAMKKIKADKKYCQPNYHDPYKKCGAKTEFYSLDAVDALLAEYERIEKNQCPTNFPRTS